MNRQTLDYLQPGYRMGDVVIYGGGGHCKNVIDVLRVLGGWNVIGVVDDGLPVGTQVLGVPVIGGGEVLAELHQRGLTQAINAVGGINNVDVRVRVFDLLMAHEFVFPTTVHPTAWVEASAALGEGITILPLAYIGSEAQIGFGAVINAGAIISHDCRLGRVVNVSPNASLAGGVSVGDYVQFGMNVTVNLNLTIGTRARVGNGATVKADVPSGTVVRAGTIWPPRLTSQQD